MRFFFFMGAKLLIRHCLATLQSDHSCVVPQAEPHRSRSQTDRRRLSFVPVINALKVPSGSAAAGLRPATSHFIILASCQYLQ